MSALICPQCGGPKTHQAPLCRSCRFPQPALKERYGHWTVLGYAGRIDRARLVNVRCDCGTARRAQFEHLESGRSQSCGCVGGKYAHGQAKGAPTPEYRCWVTMIQRCHNPKNPRFKDYGERGITVCQEWRDSFEAFFAAVGRRPGSEYSIDRIKNDCGYEAGNVRWATRSEQQRNTRRGPSADQIQDILRRLKAGESQASISRLTGVSRQKIRDIQREPRP